MLEWYKPLMAKRLSGVTTRVSGRPKYANQVAWIVQKAQVTRAMGASG